MVTALMFGGPASGEVMQVRVPPAFLRVPEVREQLGEELGVLLVAHTYRLVGRTSFGEAVYLHESPRVEVQHGR